MYNVAVTKVVCYAVPPHSSCQHLTAKSRMFEDVQASGAGSLAEGSSVDGEGSVDGHARHMRYPPSRPYPTLFSSVVRVLAGDPSSGACRS